MAPAVSRIAFLAAIATLAAPPLRAQEPVLQTDSIVLERTLCFGLCPAYRLRVARNGAVAFESRNPGDQGRRATGTIATLEFETLLSVALLTDFLELPDQIEADHQFCHQIATDHDTVVVTLFLPGRTKRVEDYQGCFWAPVALREFEQAIDSIAGSKRWVRAPARRR